MIDGFKKEKTTKKDKKTTTTKKSRKTTKKSKPKQEEIVQNIPEVKKENEDTKDNKKTILKVLVCVAVIGGALYFVYRLSEKRKRENIEEWHRNNFHPLDAC